MSHRFGYATVVVTFNDGHDGGALGWFIAQLF
jgi:hypothetical protein